MALNDLGFLAKSGYIIISGNGDMLVNGININDFANKNCHKLSRVS